MDEQDKEINPRALANKYPVLWKIFDPICKAAKSIVLQKNPSEAVQMAAVKKNGYAIEYIKNPSEAVQLAAVKQNGYAIQFIKNPSEAVEARMRLFEIDLSEIELDTQRFNDYKKDPLYVLKGLLGAKMVGYIYYRLRPNDVVYIEMLGTCREYRRKGIATKLYDALKAEYPGYTFTRDHFTADGAAFHKAYDKK